MIYIIALFCFLLGIVSGVFFTNYYLEYNFLDYMDNQDNINRIQDEIIETQEKQINSLLKENSDLNNELLNRDFL